VIGAPVTVFRVTVFRPRRDAPRQGRRLKMRRALICFVWAAFSIQSVGAECVPAPSRLDEFGSALLGAPGTSIPGNPRRAGPCAFSARYGYADCELLDSNGVYYLSYGNVVIRKRIKITPNIRLPFGLNEHDNILTVIRKLSTSYHTTLLTVSYSNGTYDVSTGLCLKNSRGEDFSFDVTFNARGRLLSVSTRAED
jgi:hypothetical protein